MPKSKYQDFSAKPSVFAARSFRSSAGQACWATVLAVLALAAGTAHADMDIPAGATVSTSGGVFDLACSDLTVGGTLNLNAGQVVNVRKVSISAGGVVNGNSGTLALSGNWSNSGSFVAGSSSVRFNEVPACATQSTISGNNTFNNLALASNLGKVFTFAAGSTQTVSGLLSLQGAPGAPMGIVSGTPGQYAFINSQGAQQITNVGVNWVQASGARLAFEQSNRTVGGNAPGWFGRADPVPALHPALLTMLALVLGIAANSAFARRRT